MTTKEKEIKGLLEEWKEALQDYKENSEDWNCYFYALEIKKRLKEEYNIEVEDI